MKGAEERDKDKENAAKTPPTPQSKSDQEAAESLTLPIQNTARDDNKDWEKLPKQDVDASELLKPSLLPEDLDWIDGRLVDSYEEMGYEGKAETAQVHPFLFTTSIAELAKEKGVDMRLGAKVTKINYSKEGVQSIEYEDRKTQGIVRIDVEAGGDVTTDIIISAGPWTGRLFPTTRIQGIRAHSVVFNADVSPYAVFTEIKLPSDYMPEHRVKKGQKRKHRARVDPEVYARPNGEVYACGK